MSRGNQPFQFVAVEGVAVDLNHDHHQRELGPLDFTPLE